ncbi:MAG TPA: hypothetical protein ENJ10_09840 [Caldithrix abyssi]|uniref:HTH cro/C1-type domain-containing protein n=1 Tax=Caldithrix abyssi TaxID=187145 RepID=A0A7V1PUP7_CALAY|nr:hypothetical protein [Caldithrix abyssi]
MEETPDTPSIFEQLKKIREDKNITLQEISAESRIQISYLKAIEAGEFEKIPEVYDKLFFQSYLSYLQVEDEERYMDLYRKLRKATFSPTPTTTMRRMVTAGDDSHPVFNKKNMIVAIPALGVIGLLLFLALNSEMISFGSQKKVRELPVRQIVQDIEENRQEALAAATPVSENISPSPSEPAVTISLTAIDTTWLRFVKDKRDTSEYLLYKGNRITLTADSVLKGLIGNAAGIDWVVNGKKEGILGQPGDVIKAIVITGNGIVRKNIKKAIKHEVTHDSTNINP